MLGVVMTSESREDVRLAARWYEDQRSGLGREFIAQIRETFASMSSRPLSFPTAYRQMRRAKLHRFPYGVFFVVNPEQRIVILAVVDLRRHPKTWKSRG
jgi:plasmid stabilization system protein ParE